MSDRKQRIFKRIFTLSYVSRSRIEGLTESGLQEIENVLQVSRQRNKTLNITGALFFNEGCFTQVLEGDESEVTAVYESIQRDARHTNVAILSTDFSDARRFSEWSMAFVGISDAARAHYASFVKNNASYWQNVTNHGLCLLMLELIDLDRHTGTQGG
jgi:hypothetical protein